MNKSWRIASYRKICSLGFVALFSLWSGLAVAVDGASPRVMVSGDSISAGFQQPSYRMPFYNTLYASGCFVDMVGDQTVTSYDINSGTAGIDYPVLNGVVDGHPAGSHWSNTTAPDDTDHQAFGGMRADQILNGGTFGGTRTLQPIGDYAASYAPDYVLLHLGTNDLAAKLNGSNPPTSPQDVTNWANQTRNDMTSIVSALQAQNSAVKILIGNMIPRAGETGDTTLIGGVEKQVLEIQMGDEYRAALTAAINGLGDPNVQMVDVASGFVNATMTSDGVHPNRAGEIHIANAYVSKFTAMGGCASGGTEPEILSPADGDPITGNSVDITWTDNGVAGIDRWWVRAGQDPSGAYDASNDYYNSGNIFNPAVSSWTIPNLPADGSTVYIGLWYLKNGSWTLADINSHTNTADGGGGGGGGSDMPEITSPAESDPIDGTSVDVTWASNGVPNITRWWVRAGQNSDGSYSAATDYYNSGNIFNPAATSWTVTNLPADGSTVYISLWYYTAGAWYLADVKQYTNTGDGGGGGGGGGSTSPEITSPVSPGPILGSSVNVSWASNGQPNIDRWWVRAGQDPSGAYDAVNDYFNSGNITNPAVDNWTVAGLPADGSTVYIGLWYLSNGVWTLADIQSYTNDDDGSGGGGSGGGGSTTPEITSPLPPAVIEGNEVTVTWELNDYPGVTRWWIRVGTNRFGDHEPENDYHNSGNISVSTRSWTVSTLPADGTTIYISLHYLVNGAWEKAPVMEYVNLPADGGGGSSPPTLEYPLPPAQLFGPTVDIGWNRNNFPGITRWWVRAGQNADASYDGVNDYYNSGNIFNNATTTWTITGLPQDGSTVYISLWYYVDGGWVLAQVEGLPSFPEPD